MTTATDTRPRGSRKKVQWRGAEITERQKEIMELSESLPKAQDVADKLNVSVNAIYVARRRVKEAMDAQTGNTNGNGGQASSPNRVLSLEKYRQERDGNGVDVEAEVGEIVQMTQAKLLELNEWERSHQEELEKIQRAKMELSRVLDSITVSVPTPVA